VTQQQHPVRTLLPTLLLLASAVVVVLVVRWGQREVSFQHTQLLVHDASLRLQSPGGDAAVLASLSRAQRDIATFVQPSVVHIEGEQRGHHGLSHTTGSGWIWDDHGHVITAWHVIQGVAEIDVHLHDGTVRRAHVVAGDPMTDIAVIKVSPKRTIAATRSDPDATSQGDMVFAFGSPLDFRFSVTGGVVSGLGRSTGGIGYGNFLQIDAPINPGSSGGPVTNHLGHVIGMSTAIAADTGSRRIEDRFTGVALAVPLGMIETIVPQLIEEGLVARGFLGVTALERGDSIAGLLGRHARRGGILLSEVPAGSPLRAAGCVPGDVVWTVGGERPATVEGLQQLLEQGGEAVMLTSHAFGGDPDAPEERTISIPSGTTQVEALRLQAPIRRLIARMDGPTQGVVISSVEPGSAARAAGLQRGDVILSVGGRATDTVDQLRSITSAVSPDTHVDVEVWRPDPNGTSGSYHTLGTRLGQRPR
jgi:S1-C subfamily serine protease